MKRVFISGKVTGLPRLYVVLKFNISEKKLRKKGYDVFNPTKEIPWDATWGEAMKICLPELKKCDSVYFQNDFYKSAGSRIEFDEAIREQKEIFLKHGKIRLYIPLDNSENIGAIINYN